MGVCGARHCDVAWAVRAGRGIWKEKEAQERHPVFRPQGLAPTRVRQDAQSLVWPPVAASAKERLGNGLDRGPALGYGQGMQHLEEKIAHLMRTVDDLSDVVARQAGEIDVLTRRVAMLMRREAEREAEGSGGMVYGDERPPHY